MRSTRATLALFFCLLLFGSACGENAPLQRRSEPPPARTDFKTGEIQGISPSDRPEAGQKATEEAPKAVRMLNDFYSTAFVDKQKWSRGAHPGIAEFFTQEARAHLAPNLGALALADLAPRLDSVRPTKQDASRISFFVEDDLSVPSGVATASFEARGTPAGGGAPVAIVHNATFWILQEGGAYRIYAYSAELRADTQTKAAAFGVPPGGLRG